MKFKIFYTFFFIIFSQLVLGQEKVIGVIENDADSKPISNVHVINLNSVIGTISNNDGVFEINASVNDTLFFSYLGFKSIKVRVTNDLIKFKNSKIKLTELAYALEEIIVTPYKLTGYLEIDAKNVPISKSYRYNIPGLPSKGYEAGSRNPGALSKVFGAIFNPVDFLYNLFGHQLNFLLISTYRLSHPSSSRKKSRSWQSHASLLLDPVFGQRASLFQWEISLSP